MPLSSIECPRVVLWSSIQGGTCGESRCGSAHGLLLAVLLARATPPPCAVLVNAAPPWAEADPTVVSGDRGTEGGAGLSADQGKERDQDRRAERHAAK